MRLRPLPLVVVPGLLQLVEKVNKKREKGLNFYEGLLNLGFLIDRKYSSKGIVTFNDGLLPKDPDSCSLPNQGRFMQRIRCGSPYSTCTFSGCHCWAKRKRYLTEMSSNQ
ncbi:hypothetical protein E5288_WYG009366 [Bos mutus]|uniref:Uncharacterized protein n=1 Tax=Bos mutus TaxID=72004 RepID=A0A6B0RB59_9CETA|nr:hypothetical protein [Bos mutus]